MTQLIEKLDEYEDVQGYFLKIFFISEKMNRNVWKVEPSSIPAGLKTGLEKRFFGKTAPIILREDWEQAPKLGHPSPYVKDMVAEQEPARVGDFVAVGQKDDGTGWCIVRIDDEHAQNLHRTGQIKFVSPSIESIHVNARGEDILWRINHLGFVDEPAYGYEAQVTGACTGKPGECIIHLAKQASVVTRLKHRWEIKLLTPCEMKRPLIHRQASVQLLHRRDMPLKQAKKEKNDEDGEWITVMGRKIFIPEGSDKNTVVVDTIKKLNYPDSKKITKTVIIDKKGPVEYDAEFSKTFTDSLIKVLGEADVVAGPLLLTRDGKWVGGRKEGFYVHSDFLDKTLKDTNISIKNSKGHNLIGVDLTNAIIEKTGIQRVKLEPNFVNVQMSNPLTSSQRGALQDYFIEKDVNPNILTIDNTGNARGIKEQTIYRSLGMSQASAMLKRRANIPLKHLKDILLK